MKITNDVNNNSDFMSHSNKEHDKTSLLSSLFSINFDSNEIKSKNNSDDLEFIFSENEIQIIDYLSSILPNLNITNLNLADFKSVKSLINSDQSINVEMKDKILSFLDSVKKYNNSIQMKFREPHNFKELKNKNLSENTSNLKIKNENLKKSPPIMKVIENASKESEENSFKINDTNIKNNGIIKFENGSDNHKILSSNNKQSNFVKNIKKNDHPNKLYQLSNLNSFKHEEKIDTTSSMDPKFNTNINYSKNQISDDIKKNKINEIKVNDKFSNLQSSIENGSKGNQYSQQNNTSITNSAFNSVLEGLLETLDLTQKGWTSKLLSRIENALANGREEIQFNLTPKNLGRLKVSIILKNGISNVKIITENSFATSALNQNENHLQKLFNEQGIDLEFLAHNESQYFGSKNSFSKYPNNNNKNNFNKSEDEIKKTNIEKGLDDDVSSRHIINVIA